MTKTAHFMAQRLVRQYGGRAHRAVFPPIPDARGLRGNREAYEGLIAARIEYLRGVRIRSSDGRWCVVDSHGTTLATRDTLREAVWYLRTQAPAWL